VNIIESSPFLHKAANVSSPAQPNIVFILIDDLGWRDLSCYGSSFYEASVLDRLALDVDPAHI
jgi:arylsulfatase A-like enzyme